MWTTCKIFHDHIERAAIEEISHSQAAPDLRDGQRIADGSASESLRRKQDELAKQIAELSKISPLWDPLRQDPRFIAMLQKHGG